MHTLLILLPLLLLLSGCDRGSPKYLLEDYMSRVSNTIEQDIDTKLETNEEIPLFPRKRERIKQTEEIRQGLIEVLDLKYCAGMLHLIAQRNSNLGRVMQPSQKMAYEIRFFSHLESCKDKLEQDSSQPQQLRKQLDAIYQIKARNLKSEIWNGIYGADEFAANFSRSEDAITTEGESGFGATKSAINALTQLAAISPESAGQFDLIKLSKLEDSYKVLHANRYGSRLLKSLLLLSETMERTSTAIHARLDKRPFCFPGHQTQKRDILHNVFIKYYSQRFQPYLSRVHREGDQWRDFTETLIGQFKPTSAVLAHYEKTLSSTSESSLWNRYIKARDAHTKAWQRILRQCNLMPQR
ncbi:DUF3080 family protein [Pontibacterium granulatum]|uniref:DUF3080 family protein n=1 Tax=Pontibacterium granulatum TaxID=2036029 RepID=UPI00249A0576|nr:DUF3080 family protein [Pontibacterium granulatum]MDI3325355.1 DUF3080 family protein [Pontibacterium granulatum]